MKTSIKFLLFCFFPLFIHSHIIDLQDYENKIFSQNGEDGVIEAILSYIGTTNKYYVEFGVEDGVQCNTRALRELHGWTGLLMDCEYENDDINLKKEFITAENINEIFEKYSVPYEFDLLSIDIDYNDFHVWKHISDKYSPRVVVIEFNALIPPNEDKVVAYDPNHNWDETAYFGASILAFKKLGNQKGYDLVYCDNNGVNLFFVRKDILESLHIELKNQNDEIKLYKRNKYILKYKDPLEREFISSQES